MSKDIDNKVLVKIQIDNKLLKTRLTRFVLKEENFGRVETKLEKDDEGGEEEDETCIKLHNQFVLLAPSIKMVLL